MNDILIRHTLAPTNCRAILILAMIAISQIVVSEEAGFRYQTIPGSSTRDYSAPSFVTKGNTTYRTIPGSSTRDYGAPSYVTKGKHNLPDHARFKHPQLRGPFVRYER
jgi:hypothetical protein